MGVWGCGYRCRCCVRMARCLCIARLGGAPRGGAPGSGPVSFFMYSHFYINKEVMMNVIVLHAARRRRLSHMVRDCVRRTSVRRTVGYGARRFVACIMRPPKCIALLRAQ